VATKNKSGLGRGIKALIPQAAEEPAVQETSMGILTENDKKTDNLAVSVDLIDPNPYQPRQVFDPDALRDLADSIREHGVLQPLIVRQNGKRYTLIAGERRLRAAKLAGLGAVPVISREISDGEMKEWALIENLQREDLNAMEEALAYEMLLDAPGATQDSVSKRVGKSRSHVANMLRLLKLPLSVQQALRAEKLTMGHARALLGLDTVVEMEALCDDVIENNLSVRELEARIRRMKVTPRPKKALSEEFTRALETERKALEESLSTRVKIEHGPRRGRIVVEYYGTEELERLLELLKHQ